MIYDLTTNTFINNGALVGVNPVKLREYDNRLWAICDNGTLIFSNNGDATTWDSENIILLPNQEPIIDFQPVQGGVILLSRVSAYAMYGSGSYTDTEILLIEDHLLLSDSAVNIDNTVYVLGNRGVHQVTLNGIAEIPHEQAAYFATLYPVWNAVSGAVQGVYLYRFHAILYLFQTGFATQGILFGLQKRTFFKIDQTLPSALPYMLELADQSVDFILATGSGRAICKSTYPAGVLSAPRTSYLQTRYEDCDSLRDKLWRHLGLTVGVPTNSVAITVYLDQSTAPTPLMVESVDLVQGDNIIELYDENGDLLRSKSISILLAIGGIEYLVDGASGQILTDPTTGVELDTDSGLATTPANFVIKEIRLKYREVGVEV